MTRLNSGNRNRQNFSRIAIFIFQKTGNDLVSNADSGDIKIMVQFPGNPILKFFLQFSNCVGGTYMRGCFILKINQCVYLIMRIILIYKINDTYLILSHR